MSAALPAWDLAAEGIAVKSRWFGLILGYAYVNFGASPDARTPLNGILTLGLVYTLLDTAYSRKGRIFLDPYPAVISFLEAVFIGLLSYFDGTLDSPFRYYYLLSLLCCAIRHSQRLTILTCVLDCVSFGVFCLSLGQPITFSEWLLPVVLIWVTWAASSLSRILKEFGDRLQMLVAERTRELQETQAQVMHQDKMAGFGLLAAGIAHEVGNPLTAISSIIQILDRRPNEPYTREKLGLVAGQLDRIQSILRELIRFSKPADHRPERVAVHEIVSEALGIAKYYQGTKSRKIVAEVPTDLPTLHGVKDELIQVIFNLVLNAIDATDKNGVIAIQANQVADLLEIRVCDDGPGIDPSGADRIFQPYFTTKSTGTGLGLFVSRRLIVRHGGTMDFESSPQVGTTFRICLPLSVGATL